MTKKTLLHFLTPDTHASPFDVNMAYDAGYDAVIPYTHVGLDQTQRLVQDAIFSRSPKSARLTGIFIGGADAMLAWRMFATARDSMVPPFEVSVMADPNGAYTTAAAMVACVEASLGKAFDQSLDGQRVVVFGGTGPVGSIAAVLCARAGSRVSVASSRGASSAQRTVDACRTAFGVETTPGDASSDAAKAGLLEEATVVLAAAAAGVRVVDSGLLSGAGRLLVAADVNAVPPSGVEGIDAQDNGKPIDAGSGKALGIGALAVGNVKYQVESGLLAAMREAERPMYAAFDEALERARAFVAAQ